MISNIFNYKLNSVCLYSAQGIHSLSEISQQVNALWIAKTLACGSVGYLAQYPVSFFGGFIRGLNLTEAETKEISESRNDEILFTLVIMTILAPISEEIIYRKYLPDTLLPNYYTLTNLQTAAISSGAFGLVHFLNYFNTRKTSRKFAKVAYQVGFCAVILGPLCSVAKTKVGLTASILVHMGFNFHGMQRIIPEEKRKEVIKKISPISILPVFIGIALITYQHQLICRLGVYCFDQLLNLMPKDHSLKLS